MEWEKLQREYEKEREIRMRLNPMRAIPLWSELTLNEKIRWAYKRGILSEEEWNRLVKKTTPILQEEDWERFLI